MKLRKCLSFFHTPTYSLKRSPYNYDKYFKYKDPCFSTKFNGFVLKKDIEKSLMLRKYIGVNKVSEINNNIKNNKNKSNNKNIKSHLNLNAINPINTTNNFLPKIKKGHGLNHVIISSNFLAYSPQGDTVFNKALRGEMEHREYLNIYKIKYGENYFGFNDKTKGINKYFDNKGVQT